MFVAGISVYGGMVFSSSASSSPFPPPSRSSTGPPLSTKAPSRSIRRCSTPWALSASSPSAASPACCSPRSAIDVHVHDTYFVIAHFHYIMVGGMVMAYLGGLHFWWPKMTGRMYNEMVGPHCRPSHLRRLQPHLLPAVRPWLSRHAPRYHTYAPEFQVLNVMSTAGASIMAVGLFPPALLSALVAAMGQTRRPQPLQRHRPGMANRSPPPTDNFDETPVVTEEPY